MTTAILVIAFLILVLVTPSAILWILLAITLLRNEKEEHKKILQHFQTKELLTELEKRKSEIKELPSNHSED